MKDADCVHFLQWALPQLHMQWSGFRKVRGQVCKRLTKRLTQLQLHTIEAYQDYLLQHPDEWPILDKLCQVTISRFYRDRQVFARLAEQILPQLAARAHATAKQRIHAWSIGSSSGEEPYTLAIVWQLLLAAQFPGVKLDILATEADAHQLERSRQACYPYSSIKNLPDTMRGAAFTEVHEDYCLRAEYKTAVQFVQQDIRESMPDDRFDLILCRNLVFTYFEEDLQRTILHEVSQRLNPLGWLVVGVHEHLPASSSDFTVASERLGLYQKHAQST